MISKSTIQQVLDQAGIVDVVARYVQLRKKGSVDVGLCPFHNEKTASFVVSGVKGLYKCFGCGKGGGVVDFVMNMDGASFPDAIRQLAGWYGVEVKETVSENYIKNRDSVAAMGVVVRFAAQYYVSVLEGVSSPTSYFTQRGFSEDTIKVFGLGWSLGQGGLVATAVAAGYSLESLEEVGLVKNGRDFMRGRAVFPIHNITGKVVAFGGRTMSKRKDVPKYLNTPETKLYNKSKILYGMYQGRRAIRISGCCYLVEGYTDVISFYQAGICNTVASSGTSVTKDQLYLIKQNAEKVVFVYDGDGAGIAAARRGLELALGVGLSVYIVPLSVGLDPDSLARSLGEGVAGFVKDNELDFIIYLASLVNGVEVSGRVKEVNELIELIAIVKDPIKRAMYIKEVSNVVGLDEVILVRRVNEVIGGGLSKKRKVTEALPRDVSPNVEMDTSPVGRLVRLVVEFGLEWMGSGLSVAQEVVGAVGDGIDEIDNEAYRYVLQEVRHVLELGLLPFSRDYYINHDREDVRALAVDLSAYQYARWSERGVLLQTQRMPSLNFQKECEGAVCSYVLGSLNDKVKELESLIKVNPEKVGVYLVTLVKLQGMVKEYSGRLGRTVI